MNVEESILTFLKKPKTWQMFISRTKTIIESVLQVAIYSKVFFVIFSNTQIAHYLQNLKQDTTDIYQVDTKGIGSYHPICQN